MFIFRLSKIAKKSKIAIAGIEKMKTSTPCPSDIVITQEARKIKTAINVRTQTNIRKPVFIMGILR